MICYVQQGQASYRYSMPDSIDYASTHARHVYTNLGSNTYSMCIISQPCVQNKTYSTIHSTQPGAIHYSTYNLTCTLLCRLMNDIWVVSLLPP